VGTAVNREDGNRGMAVEWGSDEEVGEVRLNPMPESRAVQDESPQTEPHIIRAFLSRAASQNALTTELLFLGPFDEPRG